jgi:hypothetical protein
VSFYVSTATFFLLHCDEWDRPRHEELHSKLFLNNDNPFISKPSQQEINSCECKLTQHECLGALKKEIKFPLVNCLNQRLEKGKFSVSQPQGLIACLPKEGQEKHVLKNWHPITLLSVDFKLASSCIANRLKPILQNTISQTQKGFLPATFFLLHCDEWDRVVALPRHKFVTGATLLQLEISV